MTGGPHGSPQPPPGSGPRPEPAVGVPVRDTLLDRVGVVMGQEGPYLRLRPLSGGREWDADPGSIQLLTQAELLSARVAELNARSRKDGC
ncbi:hypothetical protein [Streptomyces sp. NPDC051776]|uniref:hypothetical protein n=1 Tax=Streptomyces sp. NPDC051776 TaxID=3155414 RepID=UPI0034411F15